MIEERQENKGEIKEEKDRIYRNREVLSLITKIIGFGRRI